LETRKLTGLNASIVDLGVKLGRVKRTTDLRLFGTETRSLQRLLEFASDPMLPGLTNNPVACDEFLRMIKIETMREERQRSWSDLSVREKNKIMGALSRLILENDGDEDDVRRLTGEVYTFPDERKGQPTREAREFATLLNSCGRNDMPDIGMEICKGDRGEALERAFTLLREHRENLSNALMFVREMGIETLGAIQHFHCADQVKDTILGAIVGILLNSGEADRDRPLIGFAISKETDGEYKIKASARTTHEMVQKGVNLAIAIKRAAESVGGIGGGHNIAAGATLPLSTEGDFLSAIEREIARQLASHLSEASSMPF
ncbi:MAG: DHH family phosphoesterase, partial [Thermoplasmata archaeon]|nr:DHH family phosphoesterase [Thermoplasmata archaeon]